MQDISKHKLNYIDLGIRDYMETWDYQKNIHTSLVNAKHDALSDTISQQLIFVEHPHVYTLGKSGKSSNLLANEALLSKIGATCYRTDRGGDITYHGPGQLVGYPIFDLDKLGIGIRKYIYFMEDAIISCLDTFNIKASRIDSATGVWVKNKDGRPPSKICAIGVRVSRGISMHGFALNINTDLQYFAHINPCGFTDKSVTSMEKELGYKQEIKDVKQKMINQFQRVFGLKI